MADRRVRVQLTGVPETALWNLYQRAAAARAGRLDDPRAVEVVERLDYPFERFESPLGAMAAGMHAARVRTIDTALTRLLAGEPEATVVALGEGFETQFWRVDDGRLSWLTVDLPDIIALRRQVLPDAPRTRTFSGSATEPDWIEQVDRRRSVVITAQGLLMYFEPGQVRRLITEWAERLPGARLVFDTVTPALQAARRRTPTKAPYQPPEWTWTVGAGEVRALRGLPGVSELTQVPHVRAGGLLGFLRRVPLVRAQIPTFPVFQATLADERS